jgi:hypothetical protein
MDRRSPASNANPCAGPSTGRNLAPSSTGFTVTTRMNPRQPSSGARDPDPADAVLTDGQRGLGLDPRREPAGALDPAPPVAHVPAPRLERRDRPARVVEQAAEQGRRRRPLIERGPMVSEVTLDRGSDAITRFVGSPMAISRPVMATRMPDTSPPTVLPRLTRALWRSSVCTTSWEGFFTSARTLSSSTGRSVWRATEIVTAPITAARARRQTGKWWLRSVLRRSGLRCSQ